MPNKKQSKKVASKVAEKKEQVKQEKPEASAEAEKPLANLPKVETKRGTVLRPSGLVRIKSE